MNITHKTIQADVSAVVAKMDEYKFAIAKKIMDGRIIPFCKERNLTFFNYNGFYKFCDERGELVKVPNHIHKLLQELDWDGRPFYYWMDDYNPLALNLNDLDKKWVAPKSKDRPLAEYLFSPAFALMRG